MSRPAAGWVGSSWSAPSLSEKLCLRFSALVGSDEEVVVAVVGRCSKALTVGLGMVEWAEMTGEVEARGFGVAVEAEAVRGGAIGAVVSARAGVWGVYLQVTQVFAGDSAVPLYGFGSGLGNDHWRVEYCSARPSTNSDRTPWLQAGQ